MKNKRETFKLEDAPERCTFTCDNVSVVFYEDTERNEPKRTYHSYMGGCLYNTTAYPARDKEYYCCDRWGNYIPRSYVVEIEKLKRENRELKKPIFKSTLKTYYRG